MFISKDYMQTCCAKQLPGKLVVVEGIDGAGKSTVVRRIAEMLQQDGCAVVATREPSGTACGKMVRALLQDSSTSLIPEAEYLLFAADRAMHLAEVVRPALMKGALVICDRMGDSSYAYQGYGRGVDCDMIARCNAWLQRDIKPDLTLYLSIDYATAQERLHTRVGGAVSGYDREQASFFRSVIKGYEALYAHRDDVVTIDATRSLEDVVAQAYHHVCALVADGTID